jgi:hypothetical protein
MIAAAVLHNFDLCCGIEILEGLYSVSLEAIDSYNTRGKIHPLLSNRDIPTRKLHMTNSSVIIFNDHVMINYRMQGCSWELLRRAVLRLERW